MFSTSYPSVNSGVHMSVNGSGQFVQSHVSMIEAYEHPSRY